MLCYWRKPETKTILYKLMIHWYGRLCSIMILLEMYKCRRKRIITKDVYIEMQICAERQSKNIWLPFHLQKSRKPKTTRINMQSCGLPVLPARLIRASWLHLSANRTTGNTAKWHKPLGRCIVVSRKDKYRKRNTILPQSGRKIIEGIWYDKYAQSQAVTGRYSCCTQLIIQ